LWPPRSKPNFWFWIDTLQLVPTLIVPPQAKVSDTFLIGVQYEIIDARLILGEYTVKEPLGDIGVCVPIGTASWNGFDADERQAARHLRLYATLALAGADFSPKEPLKLTPDSPAVYWSVRPAAPGTLKGWVSISETSDSDLQIETDSNRATLPYT